MVRPDYREIKHSSELYHYGMPRRSGRYPWGSGDRPYQSTRSKELFRLKGSNTGIYEELKRQLIKSERGRKKWIDFLKSDAAKWLPKPPESVYDEKKYDSYESYFTKEGFDTFNKKTLAFFKNEIDMSKIETIRKDIGSDDYPNGDIVYSDKYQIVYGFKNNLKHSSKSEVKFKMNDFYYLSHGGPGSGRYPLGSGDRPYQKFEGTGRKPSGILGYIRSRRAKKAEEKEQKAKNQELRELMEEEQRKRQFDVDKDRVLRSGTATEVMRYQGELTNQELQNVVNRLNLESQLRSLSEKETKTAMDKVDKIMSTVKTGTEWAKIGSDTYNTFAAIYNATPDGQKKPLNLIKKGDGGGKKKD